MLDAKYWMLDYGGLPAMAPSFSRDAVAERSQARRG
jgi:hypothetical protein